MGEKRTTAYTILLVLHSSLEKENITPNEFHDTYLNLLTLEGRWEEFKSNFICEKITRIKIVLQEVDNLKNILEQVAQKTRKIPTWSRYRLSQNIIESQCVVKINKLNII